MRPTLGHLLLAAILLAPSAALAGLRVESGVAKPDIRFKANGEPGALDIDARTNDCTVTDDGTTLTFTVPLSNIKTGIDLRDEHMRDKFLQVGTYPNATLALAKANIAWPTELGKHAEGTLDADFTAHGATKAVKVKYDVSKTKQGWKAKASFTYNTTDHGIAVPNYLGISVDALQQASAVVYLVDAP